MYISPKRLKVTYPTPKVFYGAAMVQGSVVYEMIAGSSPNIRIQRVYKARPMRFRVINPKPCRI